MKKIMLCYMVLLYSYNIYSQNSCDSIPDAICSTTSPAYSNLRNGVMRISLSGSTVANFTGFLVNNAAEDGRLLVLTNALPFYCYRDVDFSPISIGTHISSSDISFLWGEDLPSCGSPSGTVVGTTSGATLLARDGEIAMLELDQSPPFDAPTYLGWDIGSVINGPSVGVNCIFQTGPSNKPKKLLSATGTYFLPVTVDCDDPNSFDTTTSSTSLLKVSHWAKGEPSFQWSRGAPLFLTSNKKVIGLYVVGNESQSSCPGGPSFFVDLYDANSTVRTALGMDNISHTTQRSVTIQKNCTGDDLSLNGSVTSDKTEKASNTIISTTNISNGHVIIYQAGTSITLDNGFVSGTDFTAEIQSCSDVITPLSKTEEDEQETADEQPASQRGFNKINTEHLNILLYPTVIDKGAVLSLTESGVESIDVTPYLTDISGRLLQKYPHEILISGNVIHIKTPDDMAAGLYFVNLVSSYSYKTFKILVK